MEQALVSLISSLTALLERLEPLLEKFENPDGSEVALARAVEIWKSTATAYAGLWTLYVVGASAVLGFAFSDKFVELSERVRKALFGLFFIFALASLVSIIQNLMVYNAATEQIRYLIAESNPAISSSISITSLCVAIPLHIAVDGCVGYILLARAKASKAPSPAPVVYP